MKVKRNNKKMFVKKAALSAILACTMLTQPVYAASVSDLDMVGWENLSTNTQASIEAGIVNIPDSVAKYHKEIGGKVYFVREQLKPNGGPESEITKGLYWLRTANIEICTMEKWNPLEYYQTITHELGHFLYFKTYSLWSQEMKDHLEAQFEYWKPYSEGCPDKEKTFAFLYAMFRAYESPYINEECRQMIRDAEDICDKLYSAGLEGMDIKVGPGVIDHVRNQLSLPGTDGDGK